MAQALYAHKNNKKIKRINIRNKNEEKKKKHKRRKVAEYTKILSDQQEN
jgi:hypothetical protein